MLRAAIVFFILAFLSFVLGANGLGGVSMEIGKTLLYVFLVLAGISMVVSLMSGRRPRSMT